ncbi:MAG: carbohydrate kinase [Chloroflexota bacterium]
MPQIVVLGEALIDLFAEQGVSLRYANSFQPSPGGAPANVAVALARLGGDVGFIGKVGSDDYGAYLMELLDQEGVDTTHFIADPGGPTMLAIVAAPSATEQQFVLYNGANDLLSVADLCQPYITSAGIFIYGSITLASNSRFAALQAVHWAKEMGSQIIFDVNLRPVLWPDLNVARQRIEESIGLATVVKLNETELEFLTGLADPVLGSQQLVEEGVQLCCVSLGEDGAYFHNGRASGHVPAFAVDVVDTTGSGDAFVAGLAHQLNQMETAVALLDDKILTQIITFANACGALAATKMGAMSASPTMEAVGELLCAKMLVDE